MYVKSERRPGGSLFPSPPPSPETKLERSQVAVALAGISVQPRGQVPLALSAA